MGTQHLAGCVLHSDNRRCCVDDVTFAGVLPSGSISAMSAGAETQLFDHLLNDTQATSIRRLNSIGQLILNGGRRDHRCLDAKGG